MVSLRNAAKTTVGFAFRLVPQIRRAVERGLTVFMFHEVSDRPSRFAEQFDLAVSTQTFRRQIVWIQSNFNVVHPADLLIDTPLPERAAIVSFDDGYLGSFENGLGILEQLQVPSILFLNMRAIVEGKPILSAIACFLDRYVPAFLDFSRAIGLPRPFHLTLNPSALMAFEARHGPIDYRAVIDYQGAFADLNTLTAWDNKKLVAFGNHLFDHWNAAALSLDELEVQYKKNEVALSTLKNRVNLFAFTNGQPKTCFSTRDIALLQALQAGKVFSGTGGVNADSRQYLLGRLALREGDNSDAQLWFQVGRAALKSAA